MPFRTSRRTLERSRFDTGGVVNPESAQSLSSYLFSDRGIYRPGETMHFGLITRSADWQATLSGLPLTVEITDPRGLVVSKTQVSLSAGAFDEVTYPHRPRRSREPTRPLLIWCAMRAGAIRSAAPRSVSRSSNRIV